MQSENSECGIKGRYAPIISVLVYPKRFTLSPPRKFSLPWEMSAEPTEGIIMRRRPFTFAFEGKDFISATPIFHIA